MQSIQSAALPLQQPIMSENCCPAGNKNYSENLVNNMGIEGDVCYHPFCVQRITRSWEAERDACREGNVTKALSNALCLRISHLGSCLLDTGLGACAPLMCLAIGVSSAYCGVRILTLQACYKCSTEGHKHAEYFNKIMTYERAAKTNLYSGSINNASLCTVAITDIIKCPLNMIAPEVLNTLTFQQECYAQQNKWWSNVRRPPC